MEYAYVEQLIAACDATAVVNLPLRGDRRVEGTAWLFAAEAAPTGTRAVRAQFCPVSCAYSIGSRAVRSSGRRRTV